MGPRPVLGCRRKVVDEPDGVPEFNDWPLSHPVRRSPRLR